MPPAQQLSPFAFDVSKGLTHSEQKFISARYFYDDLGSSLFEAITLLPEYGLTRADERLLRTYSNQIVLKTGPITVVAELGSGSGKKTKHLLSALARKQGQVLYRPIDVSQAALSACQIELQVVSQVQPICGDWLEGVRQVSETRTESGAVLLLFLGSSVGNLERSLLPSFFRSLQQYLRTGDYFLLGADLVKDVDVMLGAYDDPTGVTAAFNLNLLARMNRELNADFDLRSFAHEVRWNEEERRIEMHLLSGRDQSVSLGALEATVNFQAGETIWTESSHKFSEAELDEYARQSGFATVATWIDTEWPFAETLWQVT